MAQQGRRLAVYKKILQDNVKRWMIKEFLEYKLARLGYIYSEVLKTPLGTRIVIYAERPSRIIGKKGAVVKELSQILSAKMGVDNPQIDVIDISKVDVPEMFPKVIAYRIANAMAKGIRFRRVAFVAVRQVTEAGARGFELVISGKLSTERAKFEKYKVGKVYKSGNDSMKTVRRAAVHVLLKPGIYGIRIAIAPANAKFADDFKIKPPVKQETQQS
ncbi:30S ribosomal protein S3 [Thermoproteus tenax]|uniref:Small ribosomal subunit protein uS3 n=1 Tax=Thermoproteus tenax (strain ATCC 35583 / DSM 2078 / JCM 9277 / NBRC 100435 / Kra 1) TaxID=768679 RepID=G4RKT5_THETK|nr:30S ribosomal protein S3 [Thermoproteus tenax]CCC82180.1 30S ribosomal protein S3p [Thermoproteus tenax Kra 1]